MQWFWWVVIGFAVVFSLGKLCEDRPGFRNVLCCIIALVYPILALINIDNPDNSFMAWALLGPVVLAYYKFVYDFAEKLEGESDGDILFDLVANIEWLGWIFDIDNPTGLLAIIVSIVLAVIFAAIPIALTMVCALVLGSKVLAGIALFVPFVYCVICTIRFFQDEY